MSDKLKRVYLPICWILGHVEVEANDKPGWFKMACGRCGRDTHKAYWWQIIRGRIPYMFLWLANKTSGDSGPGYKPRFRGIDQQIKGVGGKHSCASYSYEGIVSLLEQYKSDGLPEPLLSHLIDESGWISVEDVGAEKFLDMINDDFEKESNKREREETMKKMRGEL